MAGRPTSFSYGSFNRYSATVNVGSSKGARAEGPDCNKNVPTFSPHPTAEESEMEGEPVHRLLVSAESRRSDTRDAGIRGAKKWNRD